MAEKMETDFEDMTMDELESYINSGGHQIEETHNQDSLLNEKSSTDQAEEEQEIERKETESINEEPETGKTSENDIPEFYRGKSAIELAKMLQEREKVISRQGQELGSIRSEISSLRGQIERKFDAEQPQTKAEKKDFINDLIENRGFDKDQVEAIAELVEYKASQLLTKREEEKQQKTQLKILEISNQNQAVWDNIKDLYPNSEEIELAMINEIRKDATNTLHRQNWVKSFLKEYNNKTIKQQITPSNTSNNVQKRVMRATAVKTDSRAVGGNIPSRDHLTNKSSTPEQFKESWNYYYPNNKI